MTYSTCTKCQSPTNESKSKRGQRSSNVEDEFKKKKSSIYVYGYLKDNYSLQQQQQ